MERTISLSSEHQGIRVKAFFGNILNPMKYSDNITDFYLQRKINYVNREVVKGCFKIKWGIFQRATNENKYGVILSDVNEFLIDFIRKDPELVVIGAFSSSLTKVKEEEKVKYFTPLTRLEYCSIYTSLFTPIYLNYEVTQFVHQTVKNAVKEWVSLSLINKEETLSLKEVNAPISNILHPTLSLVGEGASLCYYEKVFRQYFPQWVKVFSEDFHTIDDVNYNNSSLSLSLLENERLLEKENLENREERLAILVTDKEIPTLPPQDLLIYVCGSDQWKKEMENLSRKYYIFQKTQISHIHILQLKALPLSLTL